MIWLDKHAQFRQYVAVAQSLTVAFQRCPKQADPRYLPLPRVTHRRNIANFTTLTEIEVPDTLSPSARRIASE
jgi:hypothetical protein